MSGGGDSCTPRQGVTLLYGPSICTRSVQLDLRRSQPRVGYTVGRGGVLAGQAFLLPAPMDGVPYPQPLAGHGPQYVLWAVLLVRPVGHSPRLVPPLAADQQSQAYPSLLRVLRWGRYGHRGGTQTPEAGPLACVPRWLLSSRPHPPAVLASVVGPSPLLAWVRFPATPGLGPVVVLGGWSLGTPG